MTTLTPGMQQYMNIKNAHPDCIILFRMGDFYETFFEDAKTIARELEITLTSRGSGDSRAPLAGLPYHALDPYLAKLIKKGYKVGIVEQTEDPKLAKGLVKRELVRIVTPGTVLESSILDGNMNNYILSFAKEGDKYGVAFCDISTGEFLTCEFGEHEFLNELRRINPKEVIYPQSLEEAGIIYTLKNYNFILNSYEDRFYYNEFAGNVLKEQFDVLNLEGFGKRSEIEVSSAGALMSYIRDTQKNTLPHINNIRGYNINEFMSLDVSTIRNLELLNNIMSNNGENSLCSVLDKTVTPMGKRLMRKWIVSPLTSKDEIERRLDAVSEMTDDIIFREEIYSTLKEVYDVERLIGRVSFGNANPKDLVALKDSLVKLPLIKERLSRAKSLVLKEISSLPDVSGAQELIEKSIKNDPATTIREGNIIKRGYHSELDELREITVNAKTYLAELEEKERERTGIKSLKIRYNKVIGYFIEVTKSNLAQVPNDYIRKQSQVNSERFVTEDLKEKEVKILGAQERIYEIEYNLFMKVLEDLKVYTQDVQDVALKLAKLDCLVSFARVSQENGYHRPSLNSEGIFSIIGGRHPVIEKMGNVDFITNDCVLSNENRTMIITGPNMAGKSTYLRQNVLIILMAQMGCFVPARSANLHVVDRVFSRIGAYDDLVSGQSTFMVEMNETANILNNATENSFVILDEIGRGTSTYDGVSLAWAIAEYLNNDLKAKTLFATHYHHLNKMQERFEGIGNYNVAVDERDDKIIFLRKIVQGGTDKSYGIQVAKLAGVPDAVINSAKNVMHLIELEDEVGGKLSQSETYDASLVSGESGDALVRRFAGDESKQPGGDGEKSVEQKVIDKLVDGAREGVEKKEMGEETERVERLEKEMAEIKEMLKRAAGGQKGLF